MIMYEKQIENFVTTVFNLTDNFSITGALELRIDSDKLRVNIVTDREITFELLDRHNRLYGLPVAAESRTIAEIVSLLNLYYCLHHYDWSEAPTDN